MKKQEFINLFVEELEIENSDVRLDTVLESLDEWDSMGYMVLISLAAERFDVKLNSDDLKELEKVEDLIHKIGVNNFED